MNTIKKRVTLFSLVVSIVLVIVKIAIAWITNSTGVFSEALNNGLDLVTVLIAFFAMRLAVRPADKDHTYGHGKYENLSAFIELIVIFLLSSFIIYKSIQRIINRDFNLVLSNYIFIILAVSIILNIVRVYFIGSVSRKSNSFIMKAEFLNYSSDIISSIIVIAGLALAKYGFLLADPIASIIVAIIVLALSSRLSYRVIMNLLDYIPEEITEKINRALVRNPYVKKVERLKVHEVGDIKFINLDICLSENLYLTRVEKIKTGLKKEIKSKIPDAEIIIEVTPDFSGDNISSLTKKILSDFNDINDVHNVLVYNVGNKKDISVHVEINKNFSMEYVESLTKKAEDRIKKQINNIRRVYIHIEDSRGHEDWHDVTDKSKTMISGIKKEISGIIRPGSCHNFTILEKEGNFNISFHCRIDRKINVKKAHDITSIVENLIKNKFKSISEVVVHIEPG